MSGNSAFVNYDNETEEMTIEILMKRGFSACEAEAYLNKIYIQRLFENDNDCTNMRFNPELRIPKDRMKQFNISKKG